jgi:hypothetical protein
MKRLAKKSLIGIAVIMIAAMITLGWLFSKAMPIGTGYVAKYLCSSTFISNRDPEIVFREDVSPVNPLAKIVDYTIDRRQKSVTADSFAALGFQEQKVIIIPSRKLLLIRFGATTDRKTWNTDEFIRNVLECLPS